MMVCVKVVMPVMMCMGVMTVYERLRETLMMSLSR